MGAATWAASTWTAWGHNDVGLCHPNPSRFYTSAESEEKRDTILVSTIIIIILLMFQCFLFGRWVGLGKVGRPQIAIQCERPSYRRQDIECLVIDAIRDELRCVYKMILQPTLTKEQLIDILCDARANDTR